MSAGADAAARLLTEAHAALPTESPAREVTQALRLAHSANPRAGLRKALQATKQQGGGR